MPSGMVIGASHPKSHSDMHHYRIGETRRDEWSEIQQDHLQNAELGAIRALSMDDFEDLWGLDTRTGGFHDGDGSSVEAHSEVHDTGSHYELMWEDDPPPYVERDVSDDHDRPHWGAHADLPPSDSESNIEQAHCSPHKGGGPYSSSGFLDDPGSSYVGTPTEDSRCKSRGWGLQRSSWRGTVKKYFARLSVCLRGW